MNIQINKIGNMFIAYVKFSNGLGIQAVGSTEQEAVSNMWGIYKREINKVI